MAADFSFLTLLLLLLLLLHLSTLSTLISATTSSKQTYIIHMNHKSKPETYTTHHEWYQSLTSTSDSILYTYTTAFHGFAAYLHPEEAKSLRKHEHVLNVMEDRVHSISTTHSPQFLGLNSNFALHENSGFHNFKDIEKAAQNIIIGVLDTGIWPESKSFDDTGLPEIPKRWKGKCINTPDFNGKKLCNKKLIGAYDFTKANKKMLGLEDTESPRDLNGHGTHTASTAAGSPVKDASLFGYAKGTARGMAVYARISSYKVCSNEHCNEADILAGIERAIQDGVDIISISINTWYTNPTPTQYYLSPSTLGAFQATLNGIFFSNSAGNYGPHKSTLTNIEPWILSVGAGSIDRDFPAFVVLGNGKVFRGLSLYTGPRMGNESFSLVYQNEKHSYSNFCAIRLNQTLHQDLKPELVRGKVVICDADPMTTLVVEKGLAVRKAGGVGMIFVDSTVVKELDDDIHLVPTVSLGKKSSDLIKKYVKTNSNPTVLLGFGGTTMNARPSPMVIYFSSRGPNTVTPEILKPDIIAPGVNVLAAWPSNISPTNSKEDKRIIKFNIMSGTSMACPHASGIAALLKAAHPDWSTSAIKSAMMTTAYTIDNTNSVIRDSATGSSSNPWAYGSGYIDPRKALSPGLVYNISIEEYEKFFCTVVNINSTEDCPSKFNDPGELNYPSFSILFAKNKVVEYTRELTNVGEPMSTYEVSVTAPLAITVTVKPKKLVFRNVGEKQKYRATFMADKRPVGGIAFGSITWRNTRHQVRSPIAFTWT